MTLAASLAGCQGETVLLHDAGDGAAEAESGSADTGLGDAGPRDADLDTTAGYDASVCNDGKVGPSMVYVAAARPFCIDRTEVTQGHYQAFLDSTSKPSPPPFCIWDKDLAPTKTNPPDRPVTGVDWCDAYQYCAWAGKRLCGAIETGWVKSARDHLVNQWTYACGNGAARSAYPYGDAYAAVCNVGKSSATEPLVGVGSSALCHGTTAPFDVVMDLSGNAAEWDLSCFPEFGPSDKTDPASTVCGVRGGAATDVPGDTRCLGTRQEPMTYTSPTVGFRCCVTL